MIHQTSSCILLSITFSSQNWHKVLFPHIVVKTWWKREYKKICGSHFHHNFVTIWWIWKVFGLISWWTFQQNWSFHYPIPLSQKCDEKVMNDIWDSFFGSCLWKCLAYDNNNNNINNHQYWSTKMIHLNSAIGILFLWWYNL